MAETHPPRLVLTMDSARLGAFFPLLRQGFSVEARVGCPLEDILCRQWGIDPDYVAQRITTIFLNSRAIDDVKSALVRGGAAIALSGAMPGLVGATMRRGGYYAAMRGAMTHQESMQWEGEDFGRIRVKLFNLVVAELGPGFLRRGILLPSNELGEFLAGQPPQFWAGCRQARLDGEPVEPETLAVGKRLPSAPRFVELSVIFKE